MNEMTISVDIRPSLSALCGSEVADAVVGGMPPATPQPSADAVAAFQSAMSSLVAENHEIQAALEKVAPLPLEVSVIAQTPVAERATVQDMMAPKVKPVVAQVTPEIVREFAEVIAPLVAENREVQVALEKVAPLPLEMPVIAPEVKPVVAPVTPEIVREFAEVIAPLVAENRDVQVALEKIVPLPLEVSVIAQTPVAERATVQDMAAPEAKPVIAPEAKPVVAPEAKPVVAAEAKPVAAPEAKPVVAAEAKPVVAQVTPEIVREFAEVIAPLVAENREVQVALEKIAPLPLEVPVAVKGKVSEVELPDAGVVMQAAPVTLPRQIDAVARPESAPVAVDGVAAVVASQRTAPTPSEVLIAAAEAVADTIMVTPGLLAGEGQIRVQLRPDVLDGTEVQLNVVGKTIAVEFLPQTVDMGTLIQKCLPQLEQHLAARIHSFTIAATVGTVRRRKA